jgi:hypothetical protein
MAELAGRPSLRLYVDPTPSLRDVDFGNPSFLNADMLPPLSFTIPGVSALRCVHV